MTTDEQPRCHACGQLADAIEGAGLCKACGHEDVPSPCTLVCVFDARGETCVGCGRTLAEIAGWSRLGGMEKRAVLGRIRTT